PLHRRLHVVATPLELTEDALRGHFALQMLDRALDALVTDLDLERLARHGFTGIRQGTAHLTQSGPRGKPLRERTSSDKPYETRLERQSVEPIGALVRREATAVTGRGAFRRTREASGRRGRQSRTAGNPR